MTIVFDPGPFQEITKIQLNPYCYGRAMIGTTITQPQGQWPGSNMEYGFFVSDKGFPAKWLQWLDRKISEYVPGPPNYWFVWRLQADVLDDATSTWVPFKRGLVDFKVDFWKFHYPQYQQQCTVDRILSGGTRETLSADSMSLPWAGFHLFYPEYHLVPQNPPPPPLDPPATYPYNPINRTYFTEQRIRVYPPPLNT